MHWMWTDDLARELLASTSRDLSSWILRPVAIRVEADTDPQTVAETMLARGDEDDDPALALAA